MAGLCVVLALAVAAIASPIIAPYDPLAQDARPLLGPSTTHWFGTDDLGRDILSRVVYGARAALTVSLAAAALAAIIGVPLGLIAGFIGRWVDNAIMRIVDVFLAMPGIIMALVIVSVLGPGTLNLTLAIASFRAPVFARLARASTLTVRELDYVVAARGMGRSSSDVMSRTVLPNILGPLIVQWAVSASLAMVAAASLSFLGLGARPPEPTWGGMLSDARTYLGQSPWYGVLPGLVLVIGIASFDGIGRGLQRALSADRGRS